MAALGQASAVRPTAQVRMSISDQSSLHAALDAYDSGKLDAALPALERLAKKYPASYQVNEALGSLYAESGDYPRGLAYLRHACLLGPGEALAHANLGAFYVKLGRQSDAVSELQKAAVLDPTNAQTQSNLGQALMLADQPAAAAKAFAVASEASPRNFQLKYDWALALYDSGSDRASAGRAGEVLGTIPAEEMTSQFHSLAGDAAERAGHYAEALTHLQAAAKIDPSDANIYAVTAELLRHWTWPEAIKVADFGARLYPASTHFKMAAGIAYYAQGDYKPAVQVFSTLLAADQDNRMVADLLGRSCALLADGEYGACVGVYDYAQRHPGNAVMTTYAAIAILHQPEGERDLDKAAGLLQTVIAADPSNAEAYYQMGIVEQERLNWQQSAAYLEKSIALRPKSAEAHYRLSRAYAHLGRRKDAEAEVALHQAYAEQAKQSIDSRLQEVMKFVLKPS